MTFLGTKIIHSIIIQILMAMLSIAAMALASMAFSVYVTLQTYDHAAAINLAGSLRMQSYRIANVLSLASAGEITNPGEKLAAEASEFTEKLHRSHISQLIEETRNAPLDHSYRLVLKNWDENMAPLLASATTEGQQIPWNEIRQQYNQRLTEYVDDIDMMVTHLQRNTEGEIELLGMTEGTSIFLFFFTLIFFVMKADSNFIVPLRGLVQAAEKVEKGDLAHRISYSGVNELGLLSQTFNSMTASLQTQYRTLEDQVAERTEKLRKSNEALYFLYNTSRKISSSPYNQKLLNVFLDDLKKVVEVEAISLCINAEPNYADYDLISTQNDTGSLCYGGCDNCSLRPGQDVSTSTGSISLPLKSRDDDYGFLYVRTGDGAGLEPWKHQLLGTVAETLSTAFAFHHTMGQERRVILHEERSIIARELHDSLAQSLSYMKMETARLKKMIARGYETERVESAISDLQEGQNAAYKHLRELLVTFRIKLDAPDLHAALEHAVLEFGEQTSATVSLDYELPDYALRPNEDIHVLHILREALSNAVKHSRADNIVLRCMRSGDTGAVFTVEDNGIGMALNPEKKHHYGIYTMRERAQQLNGTLTYNRTTSGGTRVELHLDITPDFLPSEPDMPNSENLS